MSKPDKNTALFAECKRTNEKIEFSVLETLVERDTIFLYEKKYYFIFSKSGFTKGRTEKTQELGTMSL